MRNIKTVLLLEYTQDRVGTAGKHGIRIWEVPGTNPYWVLSIAVVFNLFSPRTPTDTFPLNFVPPKLLVHNSSYT
jgi:hypothetical protein